jgi:predicted transcriptional regulator
MKKYTISSREFEILEIFWEHKRNFTAKQIHEMNPALSLSTIQNTLKKLLKKNLINIDDIVYSGTVLSRSYIACISKEEFILNQYEHIEIRNLIAGFLGNQSKDNLSREIEKIEELLESQRKNL